MHETPPGEVAGEPAPLEEPRIAAAMEEQASRSTDLPARIDIENRTTEIREGDRQAKKSTAIGPRLRGGCQNWKSGKSHIGETRETIDPEHHDG